MNVDKNKQVVVLFQLLACMRNLHAKKDYKHEAKWKLNYEHKYYLHFKDKNVQVDKMEKINK